MRSGARSRSSGSPSTRRTSICASVRRRARIRRLSRPPPRRLGDARRFPTAADAGSRSHGSCDRRHAHRQRHARAAPMRDRPAFASTLSGVTLAPRQVSVDAPPAQDRARLRFGPAHISAATATSTCRKGRARAFLADEFQPRPALSVLRGRAHSRRQARIVRPRRRLRRRCGRHAPATDAGRGTATLADLELAVRGEREPLWRIPRSAFAGIAFDLAKTRHHR